MDTKLSTENLRPHVLQRALQQISSLAVDRATECCVICLGDLAEQCEAQPCRHKSFDYLCLVTWLEQRATCPLCNSDVQEVRYDLSEDGKRGKVYKVPQPSEGSDKSNGHAEEGLSSSASLSVHRSRSARARLPYEDMAIQTRHFVYRHDLYSLHVGSNKRQPAVARYRELFPQLFITDSELVSRARVWLRRELRIFEFLNTSGDLSHDHIPIRRHRPCNAEFLLEYVIAILKTMDIQGSAGQAENMIQEFLGRDNTRLFLHELKAWLRSPYASLSAWDCNVQYNRGNALPGVSQNMGEGSGEGTKIALKYAEPAEARKPPSSQAWRLYEFKGDDILEIIKLWERSVWLLGREERVVDVVTPHPSCSSQHAVLQFRYTARKDKTEARSLTEDKDKSCVRLYLMDLDSTNRTILNGERIESSRYVEIRHKDVIKFGGSKRDYIIILPPN